MLNAQQPSTEGTFDSVSGFPALTHFCVVSVTSVKHFFFLFLHFLSSLRDSYPFLPGSRGESTSIIKMCVRRAEQFAVSQHCDTGIRSRHTNAVLPSKEHAMQPLLETCQNCSSLTLLPAAKLTQILNPHYLTLLEYRAVKGKSKWVREIFCRFLRRIFCVMEDFLLLVMMPKAVLFLGLNFHDGQFTFLDSSYWVLIQSNPVSVSGSDSPAKNRGREENPMIC